MNLLSYVSELCQQEVENGNGEEKLILIDYGLNNDTLNNHYK